MREPVGEESHFGPGSGLRGVGQDGDAHQPGQAGIGMVENAEFALMAFYIAFKTRQGAGGQGRIVGKDHEPEGFHVKRLNVIGQDDGWNSGLFEQAQGTGGTTRCQLGFARGGSFGTPQDGNSRPVDADGTECECG